MRGLYAITPDVSDTAALLAACGAVLEGGAALLQYRCKHGDLVLRRTQAAALRELCAGRGVPFIVNDDVALADEVGANGVHLGGEDGDPRAARARLGAQAIIGVSCYADLSRAQRALREGASYVAFGAFHPSPTKPLAVRASTALLAQSASLGLPRVAIGGIRLDNAPALITAGAELLAVISDLFEHPDPRLRAAQYADLFTRTEPA